MITKVKKLDNFDSAIEDYYTTCSLIKSLRTQELVEILADIAHEPIFYKNIHNIVTKYLKTGELSKEDRKLLEYCHVLLYTKKCLSE